MTFITLANISTRVQAPPPRPAHRWPWSRIVLGLALSTSLAWYVFWVVMAAVELDIKHIVNWYFFARFNLTSVPRTYEGLENVGHWMPLFVFVVFLSSYVACPRKTYLAQIIYITVILHNILMFVYMVVAGQKIIRFFIVTLPIQLVYQLHNVWWLLLLAPTVLVVTCYIVPCKTSRLKPTCEHVSPAPFCCLSVKSSAVGLIVVLALHLTIPAAIAWMVRVGCLPCEGKLPKKPGLIAHRGCGFVYPENTIMSFVKSTQIPGMIGLETDVQISYDGVPFLLHDPHTVRTTDVQTKCPDVDPLGNATWLHFSSGTCPLEKLNVGSWFSRERGDRDSELAREFSQELIPRLQQYLHVAKEHGMTIIFDVTEPNIAHPLHDHYLNISLNAVLSSGIHPSKVWWLAPEKREWVVAKYPDLVQVTKTEDTPFEQFRELKIRVVNDDWSTPLKTLRQYQEANLSLNLFFIDSVFAFSYAWCVGVDSITTNNCKRLASLSENQFHQVCHNLRQTTEHQLWPLTITCLLCSLSCMTCFECMQRMRRRQQSL